MSEEWITGPRCGVDNCRSRKYIIADDGFKYCSRGHQAEDQLVTGLDEDDFMGLAAKKTKTGPSDNEYDREPVQERFLRGRDAIELFLQCYQLVLRKQVWWLIQQQKFPADLELIVKNLWELRLYTIKHMLVETESGSQKFASRASSQSSSQPGLSSSQPRAAESQNSSFRSGAGSRLQRRGKLPRLSESLGIIYAAALLLRLPISVGDVQSWTTEDEFPFLRAINNLPRAMKQGLPPNLSRAFEARTGAPECGRLQVVTLEAVQLYSETFGLQVPPINHDLILLKHITSLTLPLDLFALVQFLGHLLKVEYKFPDPEVDYVYLSLHPEVELAGLICVGVKLLYPFDIDGSKAHILREADEPTALSVDWSAWNEFHAKATIDFDHQANSDPYEQIMDEDEVTAGNAKMLALTDRDILRMSAEQMDRYMDWFQQTWLPHDAGGTDPEVEEGDDFLKALWRMFPLRKINAQGQSANLTEVAAEDPVHSSLAAVSRMQGTLVLMTTSSDDELNVIRPGSRYARYRVAEDLPAIAKPFFESMAAAVALNVQQLMRVVFKIETRLEREAKNQRAGEHDEPQDRDDLEADHVNEGNVDSQDPNSPDSVDAMSE